MSLTGDLVTFILADTDVTDQIGDRLFDLYVPEDAVYPYMTIIRESMDIEDHLSGKTPLRMSMYTLTVASETSVSGEAVEEPLIALLASIRGDIGSSKVRSIYYHGSTDSFIPPVDGSEESVHLIHLSLEVHWFST